MPYTVVCLPDKCTDHQVALSAWKSSTLAQGQSYAAQAGSWLG